MNTGSYLSALAGGGFVNAMIPGPGGCPMASLPVCLPPGARFLLDNMGQGWYHKINKDS
jgi:hypothetical protein